MRVDAQQTRRDIRLMFDKWGIDATEFEIERQSELLANGTRRRLEGVSVRYIRDGKWQIVSCYSANNFSLNIRQVYLFLDRIRIAEKQGVQYQGLEYTREVSTTTNDKREKDRREDLLEAYDILGASPDDPVELIKDIFRRKSMYYHPDKSGGSDEKFKRLNQAFETILKSKGNIP